VPGDDLIRADYAHRPEPAYFADHRPDAHQVVWQPDVYTSAGLIAGALGGMTIVDYGCGTAGKLVALADRFQIVGIDYGSNIEWCRRTHDVGRWVEHDFDGDEPVGVDVRGAVVVCADVIEHTTRPALLVAKLSQALNDGALAVLISTPERESTYGLWHAGPPPNEAHVREWTVRELSAFLRRAGLQHGSVGLTRSNTLDNQPNTILCVYVADRDRLEIVEDVLIDAPRPPAPPPPPPPPAPPPPAPPPPAPPPPPPTLTTRVRRRIARRIAGD